MWTIDPYELVLTVLGLVALAAAVLPSVLHGRAMSLPIILVGIGVAVFVIPSPLRAPDPRAELQLTEHVAELGVLVSLVGTGLSIDRPIGWRSWAPTWRLLAIAMPAGIALTALIGWWWLGLAPAGALLLGAVLAPTDPVLAGDVQVGEPSVDPDQAVGEDEVRVTLTAEAGLNDGLAFPFVYGAIALATGGSFGRWLAVDVIARVAIGIVVGIVVGRAVARIAFRPPKQMTSLAEASEGFVGITLMFLAYGVAELAQGYGFVSVFVAALALRSQERHDQFHQVLHDFTTQVERLIVVVLLVLLGASLVGGLLDGVTWQVVTVAVVMVVLIRPVTASVALLGTAMPTGERRAISFLGIRGIGSIYYLAYALGAAEFDRADTLWAVVACTLLVSITMHGVTTTAILRRLDHRRERRAARTAELSK